MRGRHIALASIGVVLVACTAAPDIPNDLQHNTFPSNSGSSTRTGSGSSSGDDSNDALPGSTPTSGTKSADAGPAPGTGTDAGSTATDAGTTSTTPTGPCAGATSANACFQCCEQNNPGTVDELNGFWDQCVCDPGRCGNECAQSWCAGFYPFQGDPCDQCLNAQEAACNTQADNACAGDASCSKLLQCDDTSGCANKP